ncbi:MAG: hypothetical protein IPJ43_06430 [Saprospiraceae bacterium]|nr:hypothetical protein [Saprospiraceae bacterium]
MYITDNNGNSWKAANNGLTNTNITSIAAHKKNIFAGINYVGIYYSSNNGNSWTEVNNGLTHKGINVLQLTETMFSLEHTVVFMSLITMGLHGRFLILV